MILLYRKYLKKYLKYVIVGPALKLTEAILELCAPLIMAAIIDRGVANSDTAYIFRMSGLLAGLGIAGFLCAVVCQYSASIASQGCGTDIREDLFAHITALAYRDSDKFGAASLMNRMGADINQVQLSVAMLIRLVVRAPFLAMGGIVMAMLISVKFSLIFLAAVIIIVIIYCLVMSRTLPGYSTLQGKLDRIAKILSENLSGARIIRAMSGGTRESARFAAANTEHNESAVRIARISAMLNPLTFTVVNIAITALLYFGGRAPEGEISVGELVAVVNYMLQTLAALMAAASLFQIFTKAVAGGSRINEIFASPAENFIISEKSKATSAYPDLFNPDAPTLTLRDVGFHYPGANKNAVGGVGFSLNKGEILGVIGATGSGKSTLVNLICGFWGACEGEILLGGTDIKQYPPGKLMTVIGLVPQQSALLSGSIAENLRMGADISEEILWRALEAAQADEIVRGKDGGLAYKIEQGAKNLSGGQRQRLCIARALAKRPALLILDDSSSALDFYTEAKLRESVRNFDRSLTQIIVSQRVGSIMHADRILLIEEGKPAAYGTHDELYKSCELYSEMCRVQLGD